MMTSSKKDLPLLPDGKIKAVCRAEKVSIIDIIL